MGWKTAHPVRECDTYLTCYDECVAIVQLKSLLGRGKAQGVTMADVSGVGVMGTFVGGPVDLTHFESALKEHWRQRTRGEEDVPAKTRIFVGSKISLWEPETHTSLGYAVAHSNLNGVARYQGNFLWVCMFDIYVAERDVYVQ